MTFSCQEQLAGFSEISLYLLTEVSGWPLVVTDANAGKIVITAEEHEVDGTIEPDSIRINDKPRTDEAGTIWPIDIGFMYLYRGEPMEQLLEQYAGQPCVAIACLNDGTRKLYGTDQEPVYMTWQNVYGEKIEDRSGVDISIRGDMQQRPSFYNPEA